MAQVTRTLSAQGSALLNRLKTMKNAEAKVGWFESAVYPDGTPVAYVASIQEFGDGKIPARPFMRSTISEKKVEWKRLLASGAKAIIAGNETIGTVMEKTGQKSSGDIRKTISMISSPPLKASTIAARLREKSDNKTVGALDKPLVHTGVLLNTLTSITQEKE